MVTLSIVIVSYNTRDLLDECLKSVASQTRVTHEVFVVDNASVDGTPEFIARQFPQVRLIANPSNSGFSAANNQALRAASGRYLLLLNPDTIVLDEALDRMADYLDSHPQVGVVGAQMLNEDRTVQRYETWFPRLLSYIFNRFLVRFRGPLGNQEVEYVCGACLMIRAETMRQIGMLDENIFMYTEDVDWCLRAKRAGWKIFHNGDARIVHLAGRASRKDLTTRVFNARQAFLYFYRKHYSLVSYLLLKAIILCESLAKIIFDSVTYPWVGAEARNIKRARIRGFVSLALRLPYAPVFLKPAR
jgi:GT2 family glycosyltransferase